MWEYLIYQYGTQIMLVVIAVIFGGLGYLAKKVADKLVSNQIICTVVKTAVQYVEQVCKDIHGQDKLNKALDAATDLLAEKGIHLTVAQLTVYIEAALAEFNKAFSAKEDTTADTAVIGFDTNSGEIGEVTEAE